MPKGKSKTSGEQTAVEAEFKWSLQALAQPGAVQQELFPDAEAIGQALVDRYRLAYKAHKAAGFGKFSPVQRGRLRTLEATLADLSQEHNQAFWMDPEALANDPRWAQVRGHAQAALEAFGWPVERPTNQT